MSIPETRPGHSIRPATPDEAASIASVLYRSFAEYELLYTPEAFAATTLTTEKVRSRLREGPVWVAAQSNLGAQDDLIIGTVSAVLKGEGVYVRGMAILPTARGLGIGRGLLERVESFAYEQGSGRLFLSTTPFLTRAIQLYEHFGFQRNEVGPHDLFGTPLFTMVKTLRFV